MDLPADAAFNETIKQIREHLALAQMKLRGLTGKRGEVSSEIADQLTTLEEPMRKLASISEGE